MQNELRQVTPAQIKGGTFKAITVIEDKNRILVFFDDGSFLVENRGYKVDLRGPMGYSKS
jgi:hypothetical protein